MTAEHELLRTQAAPLLRALGAAAALEQADGGCERDQLLRSLALLRQSCCAANAASTMEAPVFSNLEVEAAWLVLIRLQGHAGTDVAACARVMGTSDNWSMVLRGSRQVRRALQSMAPGMRQALLEAAGAVDLLASLPTQALQRDQVEDPTARKVRFQEDDVEKQPWAAIAVPDQQPQQQLPNQLPRLLQQRHLDGQPGFEKGKQQFQQPSPAQLKRQPTVSTGNPFDPARLGGAAADSRTNPFAARPEATNRAPLVKCGGA